MVVGQPLNVDHRHVKYRDCHADVTFQGEDCLGAACDDVHPACGCAAYKLETRGREGSRTATDV